MISNNGHDENGNIRGGKPGDQTGEEWEIRPWYQRGWNCVLRHPDAQVRETIAQLAEKSARNELIGYNQDDRLLIGSIWRQVHTTPPKSVLPVMQTALPESQLWRRQRDTY